MASSGQTLEDQQILCGVTIVVAVEDRQLESSCQEWVQQLGGEFVWDIKGPGVTHCLFEVRDKKAKVDKKISDIYAKARGDSNIKIVSPMWLKACFESKCYVSESDFPPTLHPRMSLGMEKDAAKPPPVLPPPPPPPIHNQKLLLAPRSKRRIDFPEDTPDVSTPLHKRPPSPPSSLLALTPIPHNSTPHSSTPSSLSSRSPTFSSSRRPSSPPYRSTPYVRSFSSSSPPHSSSPDDSSRSPILQAADSETTVSKSGYDAETSSVSKSGNDDVSQVEDKSEADDGLVNGFKVLTERIKLLQHEVVAPTLFLAPPTLSPPKKIKKSKSSKISRALLESEEVTPNKGPQSITRENSQEFAQQMTSSNLSLHYSHSSFHASDDDASGACSQVVTYDNTSMTSKTALLELALRNAETTSDRENMRKELAGLLSSYDTKSPMKASFVGKPKYEEPNPNLFVLPPPKKVRTFTLTGFSNEDKQRFTTIIQGLGGEVTQEVIARATTHVVADKPAQSEKYMSGCAAGCWVVHAAYLKACEDAGEWMDEKQFEWTQTNFQTSLDAKSKNWIDTPHKCRLEVENQQKEGSDPSLYGMFSCMHCVLMQDVQSSPLVRLLEAGGAKTKTFTSLDELTLEFMRGVTCAFSKRISEQTMAFHNLVTKLGLPHLVLADLETILFSGHAAPYHVRFFPKEFEFPQLQKPLPHLPTKQKEKEREKEKEKKEKKEEKVKEKEKEKEKEKQKEKEEKVKEKEKEKEKAKEKERERESTTKAIEKQKPTSPQKPRKTSPPKPRPPSPHTSPQKPKQKSPQKRTTVSKAERNRSNSPPDAKTRKTDSSSPPPSKSRKVDSSPPKTRGKDVSPQKPKPKPSAAAAKLSKQESVYEFQEDSPPKKRQSTRKKK